jgi:tRNA U55 pseudouridine synthase TruB
MKRYDSVIEFLNNILPSFREAREVRNKIRTIYLRNINRIESGKNLQKIEWDRSHELGFLIERKHHRIQAKMEERDTHNPTRRIEKNNFTIREYCTYSSQDAEEIKREMQSVTKLIKMRNVLSSIIELSIYVVIIGVVLLFALILTGNIQYIS